MHELIVLRHAEAVASAPTGVDRDRTLSPAGEAQATQAGQWITKHVGMPQRVLCSSAERARQTLAMAGRAFTDPVPAITHTDAIYEATPGELLSLLDTLGGDAERVLLVGHNPGLEQLVALLCDGRSEGFRGMPSAGIAWIKLDDGLLEPGHGQLAAFQAP